LAINLRTKNLLSSLEAQAHISLEPYYLGVVEAPGSHSYLSQVYQFRIKLPVALITIIVVRVYIGTS